MLAAASGAELQLHEYALTERIEDEGFALAQRFFAEAQIGALVSVGHRLINLAVRALSRDRHIAQRIIEEGSEAKSLELRTLAAIVHDDYKPFDEEGQTWLSLNREAVRQIRRYYGEEYPEVVLPFSEFVVTEEWKALDAQRSISFHRWRKEHPLVQGVDETSGRSVPVLDYQGRVHGRSFTSTPKPYRAADSVAQDAVTAAQKGTLAIGKYAHDVLSGVTAILPRISGGAFGCRPD